MLVVREDVALRGRERGDVAGLVADGARARMAEGARCKQVEIVLEEIPAVHQAMARANPGDLVVLCVDKHGAVLAELGDDVAPGPGRRARRRGRRRPGHAVPAHRGRTDPQQ